MRGRLAAVNFFLGCVGTIQVGRILMYQRSIKGGDMKEELSRELAEEQHVVKELVGKGKDAMGKVTKA